MQLKAPPRTTRLPRLVATAGSRRTASTTLVSEASASTVTSPGAARTASAMNCAAETPHGDPFGELAPVLPKPARAGSTDSRQRGRRGGRIAECGSGARQHTVCAVHKVCHAFCDATLERPQRALRRGAQRESDPTAFLLLATRGSLPAQLARPCAPPFHTGVARWRSPSASSRSQRWWSAQAPQPASQGASARAFGAQRAAWRIRSCSAARAQLQASRQAWWIRGCGAERTRLRALTHVWRVEGHENGEGIVHARICVDDELAAPHGLGRKAQSDDCCTGSAVARALALR